MFIEPKVSFGSELSLFVIASLLVIAGASDRSVHFNVDLSC